ncbi:MAG: hypothetical protein WDW36_005198 [Sanguina aurantia]
MQSGATPGPYGSNPIPAAYSQQPPGPRPLPNGPPAMAAFPGAAGGGGMRPPGAMHGGPAKASPQPMQQLPPGPGSMMQPPGQGMRMPPPPGQQGMGLMMAPPGQQPMGPPAMAAFPWASPGAAVRPPGPGMMQAPPPGPGVMHAPPGQGMMGGMQPPLGPGMGGMGPTGPMSFAPPPPGSIPGPQPNGFMPSNPPPPAPAFTGPPPQMPFNAAGPPGMMPGAPPPPPPGGLPSGGFRPAGDGRSAPPPFMTGYDVYGNPQGAVFGRHPEQATPHVDVQRRRPSHPRSSSDGCRRLGVGIPASSGSPALHIPTFGHDEIKRAGPRCRNCCCTSEPGPQQQLLQPQMSHQQQQQQLMEQFESLALVGAMGPGQAEGADPMAMPRPVGGAFAQAMAAQPPWDLGNCSSDNMRMTVNAIPATTALRSRWPLPLGAIVHPMADEAFGRTVPVVSLGPAGIVRCRRCRTYMNPFMVWMDGGRRFKCNVCALLNETPPEYFSSLDHNGQRKDAEERPELGCGTVEYVAPDEYMVRAPMPPVFFFVIDVSYSAVASGMVATAAAAIRECLHKLPGDERTLVGFLTFDSSLHYYNLKSSLSQPQMMVVTELDDPFVPLPDDLLVNLQESMHVVEALLDSLLTTFAANTNLESAMGPALQAAFLVTSHIGGKLLLFQSSVPSLGVGKVKNRESAAMYGTDREANLRNPEDAFYKRFAAECSRIQLTVDIFSFNMQYTDLASISAIPRYTCGELYYYPGYSSQRDQVKLRSEIVHNLTRPTAWEAVMRIRCSKGLRISSFHGHFFNRSSDLLALPTCDPDKAFAVQMAHEESIVSSPVAYVQCALLYTNSNGERRIRVHTMAVPVVQELSEMYKAADGAALACLMAKLAVEKSLCARLDETRGSVTTKLVSALKEFRLMHASSLRQSNKIIYPDTLKYLPLWCLGITKSAALRGGAKDVNADERIAVGHEIMSAPVLALCRLAYPTLYVLHDPSGPWGLSASSPLPPCSPLSMAALSDAGAYLLDNGRMLVLWVGRMLSPQWAAEVFGLDSGAGPDSKPLSVEPVKDTPMSRRVCQVISTLREHRPVYQQCFVVRQGSPQEVHALPYFVEDRSQASPSYSDYMVTLHKAILSK